MPKKYKRHPNGFGTVTHLSGNRSKPWWARLPAEEDENGDFVRRTLGYYATRNEALDALASYRLDPPAPKSELTLRELHEEWKLIAYRGLDHTTVNNYEAAWKYMTELYKFKVKDLRSGQFQACIDRAAGKNLSASSLEKIKAVMTMLETYAEQNDIIKKNYASFVKLTKPERQEKPYFSETQVEVIRRGAEAHVGVADLILVLIYTGWRIQEFCDLTVFDYDRQNQTLYGGLKTDAGKGRRVPVTEAIRPIVEKYAAQNGPALFCYLWDNAGKGSRYREELRPWPVKRLRQAFYDTLDALGIVAPEGEKYTPHSTRHTCNTRMKKLGVPKETRMKILGQADEKTNEKTYSHTDLEEMEQALTGLYAS